MGAVRSNSKIDKRQDDSFYGKHACQDQITKLTARKVISDADRELQSTQP